MPTFHGLPVVEAEASVYLRALESDGGIAFDPVNCRWANAVRRMFGNGTAAFFRTVAYMEISPGRVTRFAVPAEVRAAIEEFDATGQMPTGTFVFRPFTPGQALARKSARERKRVVTAGGVAKLRERRLERAATRGPVGRHLPRGGSDWIGPSRERMQPVP